LSTYKVDSVVSDEAAGAGAEEADAAEAKEAGADEAGTPAAVPAAVPGPVMPGTLPDGEGLPAVEGEVLPAGEVLPLLLVAAGAELPEGEAAADPGVEEERGETSEIGFSVVIEVVKVVAREPVPETMTTGVVTIVSGPVVEG